MPTLGELASIRPLKDEYFEYYDNYISKVPDGNVVEVLTQQETELRSFFSRISESEGETVHAPYKWSLKQVAGHLIDGERIFADRLHRFALGEKQAQPGMNQDVYIAGADYSLVTLASLVDELIFCRKANLLLLKRIRPEAWQNRGVASGHEVTVRALAWMLAGHVIHHMRILRVRTGITD